MIPLGLSVAQQMDLNSTLVSDHSLYITAQVLKLDGTRLADLSWRVLDGQVNVDDSATITRNCTLTLLDPNRTMDFDTDSPSDGSLYLDRMIQVNYSVRKPGGTQYTIPVFTGPVMKLNRNNDVITLEAQGKELLAMGMVMRPQTYRKGWNKVDVIRQVLNTQTGERKFDLPHLASLLPKDYSIGRGNTPWGVARGLAQSMDRQLFYDGRGTCRMRRSWGPTLFTFRQGDGGSVVSDPQITFTSDELKNTVWVRGAVPAGAKTAVEYLAIARDRHPLSPTRLARSGSPRYLVETIENSSITTVSEAMRLAETKLNEFLTQTVEVAFDSIPIPHLDPGDFVQLETDEFATSFRLSRYSIPLTAGEAMSTGYLRRVSMKARFVRR
jgi:hypothetical protein